MRLNVLELADLHASAGTLKQSLAEIGLRAGPLSGSSQWG
jgi:hypothetical protein